MLNWLKRFYYDRWGYPEDAAAPLEDERVGAVPVEWGVDMDGMSTTSTWLGDEQKFSTKGRCKRCWGGLLARADDGHTWTGIRCRVCGVRLE